ncbi:DEAD/DEAH box helicase [Moraxella pluranimalium]|uniref:DEAD/DEAH box helicase n=1 Tax=Moraxella pluranimalium TaxID=470453 RepID=A0A1T0CLE8_9GAMM|nr:DEAD/DEAH box helicase [Moraxella pluranimalium]OOS23170.1 DEAD/DEAH box helicase [Moraxella pluranimalium]
MTNQLHAADTAQADEQAGEFVLQFSDLGLHKGIIKALTKSGYTTPTPIQAQAIPHALNGRDLLLSAQTGSGKTAAFVLPVLDKMSRLPKLEKHIHALILTPTRELALQVHDSVRRYGDGMRGMFSVPLVGGAPYGGQLRALRKGVQVVIATPGRLIDHMREGRVDLSGLDMLILDEADRMLDMGFADDIKEILENTPSTRQTVMSSATWDGAVGKIAESFTTNPERVSIKVESAHIDESVYFCDDFNHKNKILLEVLNNPEIKQAVIFTATKLSTEKLADTLNEVGYKARYLHGDLPQGKRNRIVSDMKAGKCDLLIATDVAARGIDISAISHVVNYDLPRQVEDYVHRIGRCGRAGRTGVAVNLCSLDDNKQLANINRYLKRDMAIATIEGLEPRRNFGIIDEPRRKGKGGRNRRRDDRDGARQERGGFGRKSRFEGRSDRFESRGERFDDAKRFERGAERGDRFEHRGERFESRGERSFERNHERSHRRNFDQPKSERFNREERFEHRERGDRSDRSFDKPYKNRDSYYRADGDRFERSECNERGFEHRGERRFDKGFDKGFDVPKFDRNDRFERGARADRREKFGKDKPSFDKGAKAGAKSFKDRPHGSHRPKAVEEVFFAKRQAKKARKFGDA